MEEEVMMQIQKLWTGPDPNSMVPTELLTNWTLPYVLSVT